MAGMNSGYANERELARAIAAAKTKKKATPKPKPTPSGSRTVTNAASTMTRQRGTIKPVPKATKKATPTPKPKATLGPLPKNPTLNDYLIRGLKPPVKGKGKLPSDADVRLRGYNA